ncbi:MAG: hypothetical protein WD071_13655 [Pseudohongiella sp.]|uniref:hypothetical protein n=1 Tax=Pseudohongiella sp. TaxID=1979412 RepID=UPI0034A06680
MKNSLILKFVAAALTGVVLLVALAVVFIHLTDPTRETISTAPPENEVRQPQAPEPATSTAPGAPRTGVAPPAFAAETDEHDTGNTP